MKARSGNFNFSETTPTKVSEMKEGEWRLTDSGIYARVGSEVKVHLLDNYEFRVTRVGSITQTGSDSLSDSLSISIPIDANICIVGVAYYGAIDLAFSTLNLGSSKTDFTRIRAENNDSDFGMTALYYLLNPPFGTKTLYWEWPSQPEEGAVISIAFYKNVSMEEPIVMSAGQGESNDGVAEVDIYGSDRDMAIGVAYIYSGTEEVVPGTWTNLTKQAEHYHNFDTGSWAEESLLSDAAVHVSVDCSGNCDNYITLSCAVLQYDGNFSLEDLVFFDTFLAYDTENWLLTDDGGHTRFNNSLWEQYTTDDLPEYRAKYLTLQKDIDFVDDVIEVTAKININQVNYNAAAGETYAYLRLYDGIKGGINIGMYIEMQDSSDPNPGHIWFRNWGSSTTWYPPPGGTGAPTEHLIKFRVDRSGGGTAYFWGWNPSQSQWEWDGNTNGLLLDSGFDGSFPLGLYLCLLSLDSENYLVGGFDWVKVIEGVLV